jgi:hypothetical protein
MPYSMDEEQGWANRGSFCTDTLRSVWEQRLGIDFSWVLGFRCQGTQLFCFRWGFVPIEGIEYDIRLWR